MLEGTSSDAASDLVEVFDVACVLMDEDGAGDF